MEASAVSALVEAGLASCRVEVEGGGGKFEVTVVGEVFDGLSPVKRQQLVYATLKEVIADGSVHAVTIRTFTPAQWSARGA
ncbi:MAG TPA: BolA/IbaG family iron-sulfur metabolism protein [Pseudomonadales bacterium]|nr:BolA/IbaG family iron-sulfur metabolism protein [Pseudomonadales bacterium]